MSTATTEAYSERHFHGAIALAMAQPSMAAMLKRAKFGLLWSATTPNSAPGQFDFWQGYAKAMHDMADGTAAGFAARDAGTSGGHHLPSFLLAAADCLGDDAYRLTGAQIRDRLAHAGIQTAAHPVAQHQVVRSGLEVGAICAVDSNSQQVAAHGEDSAGGQPTARRT